MKHLGFISTILTCFVIFAVAGCMLLNAIVLNDNTGPTYSSIDISQILSDSAINKDNVGSPVGPNTNVSTPVANITDSYNVLLLVPDASSGCTDTIIVVNFYPEECRISTLSIPRDTCVVTPDGGLDKINLIYAVYGIEALCDSIKQLTAIDINYYFVLNIETVRDVIDYLGGVYYNLPVDIYYIDYGQKFYVDIKAGYQLYNGAMAEQLLRFRKYNDWYNATAEQLEYYGGSDMNRMRTQIDFIKAAISQKFTLKYLTNINSILSILMERTDTNINTDTMMSILSDTILAIDKFKSISDNMFSFYLGGDEDYRYSNVYHKDIYFWIPDDTFCSSDGKVYTSDQITMLLFLNDKEAVSTK